MKNKWRYLIVIMIVIIIGFVSYKLFLLNKYKSEKVLINRESIFNEILTINELENTKDSERLSFEGLTIKNYFKEYTESENSPIFKVKYNDDGEVNSFYSISKYDHYINFLNLNSFEIYDENDNINYDFSTEENTKKYLKEKNINNDIDLLNYIKDNYYIENNLFMSKKAMINNYLINSFVELTLPDFENIVLINGQINGYIINIKNTNVKEIHIIHEDAQYILTLCGEEITKKEFIIELLKTIKFY